MLDANKLNQNLLRYSTRADRTAQTDREAPEMEEEHLSAELPLMNTDIVYKALSLYTQGVPLSIIGSQLMIPTETIELWSSNYESLIAMTTRKGSPSHIPAKRFDGTISPLPSKPNKHHEQRELTRIMAAIESASVKRPEALATLCHIWRTRSTTTNTGLVLSEPEQLQQILQIFKNRIAMNRWRFRVQAWAGCSEEWLQEQWHCPDAVNFELKATLCKPSTAYPNGKGLLYLTNPNEQQLVYQSNIAINHPDQVRLPKKYSSYLLRYALFITSVQLM